jgi:hypothetical protein
MKIRDLSTETCPSGTRIRVTRVARSKAEDLGYVDDTVRLTGTSGTTRSLSNAGRLAQLDVDWDDPTLRLMLAAEDEVELL